MSNAIVTGFGRAIGVFDMTPEFKVVERRIRRSEQSPIEAGAWHRRQDANSVGETSLLGEVREWTLNWKMGTKAEADVLRSYYRAAKGSAGLFLYYPPAETGNSNLCHDGDSLISPVWKRMTAKTSVATDTATPPTGASGAFALQNGGSATIPAFVSAKAGSFPSAGTLIAFGGYTQYHSAATVSGTRCRLRIRNADTGAEHHATWGYVTSWEVTANSTGVIPITVVDGAWTRMFILLTAGADGVGVFPERRYLEIQQGSISIPSARASTLHAGFMLEEAKILQGITGAGTYNVPRKHVLVRITDSPLRIQRNGPNLYSMQVTLREVLSAS